MSRRGVAFSTARLNTSPALGLDGMSCRQSIAVGDAASSATSWVVCLQYSRLERGGNPALRTVPLKFEEPAIP